MEGRETKMPIEEVLLEEAPGANSFVGLLQPLADALGMSVGAIGTIAFLLMGIVMGMTAYSMTRSITISLLATGGAVIAGTMMGIFPLWVAVMYFVMAVSTILFSRFDIGLSGKKQASIKSNVSVAIHAEGNRQALVLKIEQHSKEFSQYINNLDILLGIKTVNQSSVNGLELTQDNQLLIDGRYDWYITDKHPRLDVFKVVGLHKEKTGKDVTYMLGQKDSIPFLGKIPNALAVTKFNTEDTVGLINKEAGLK